MHVTRAMIKGSCIWQMLSGDNSCVDNLNIIMTNGWFDLFCTLIEDTLHYERFPTFKFQDLFITVTKVKIDGLFKVILCSPTTADMLFMTAGGFGMLYPKWMLNNIVVVNWTILRGHQDNDKLCSTQWCYILDFGGQSLVINWDAHFSLRSMIRMSHMTWLLADFDTASLVPQLCELKKFSHFSSTWVKYPKDKGVYVYRALTGSYQQQEQAGNVGVDSCGVMTVPAGISPSLSTTNDSDLLLAGDMRSFMSLFEKLDRDDVGIEMLNGGEDVTKVGVAEVRVGLSSIVAFANVNAKYGCGTAGISRNDNYRHWVSLSCGLGGLVGYCSIYICATKTTASAWILEKLFLTKLAGYKMHKSKPTAISFLLGTRLQSSQFQTITSPYMPTACLHKEQDLRQILNIKHADQERKAFDMCWTTETDLVQPVNAPAEAPTANAMADAPTVNATAQLSSVSAMAKALLAKPLYGGQAFNMCWDLDNKPAETTPLRPPAASDDLCWEERPPPPVAADAVDASTPSTAGQYDLCRDDQPAALVAEFQGESQGDTAVGDGLHQVDPTAVPTAGLVTSGRLSPSVVPSEGSAIAMVRVEAGEELVTRADERLCRMELMMSCHTTLGRANQSGSNSSIPYTASN
ncbi:hypothetical protein P692DRAFT_201806857 [Suillus brevipes Sb2]|nr:hypothetical protein P692DRAFT_201806857 [Suillus brevipes Sb2]